ncbi:uncharacterized protein LOC124885855 [Capsicum annuum]|uniref:uncharacterized protein LOC124885855 n=1 Tax=Capsicum annuum TaxID=4072 RepID=UPI001FB157FF|nr:uncharacterized protein LOC124885855 [Capsicum annuum]
MDSCANFSLGLSQLDTKKQDIHVEFVSGTFDFKEPNFAENCSKHRNDPTTMKRLKEEANSKSKKSSSKTASKKKFDDFGRPRLPKGKILKFTILEFSIITSLKCTGDIDEFMYTSSSKSPLMSKYFPESGGGNEDQSRVVTGDDDYDDFTTVPTQEFLRKARLAKPVSTEQPSKIRKTVMFQEVSPAATDGQKSTNKLQIRVSDFDHRYQVEIGVSPECEQLKFVSSSSATPEGTSKSNLDMEQIKSYIKTYVNEQIVELKTLISNIPAEDEHMNDQEEGHEEESKNTHITDMEDISDEHNDAIEAGCTEDLTIQHSPQMKHLEDKHNAAVKAGCTAELSIHLEDEHNATIVAGCTKEFSIQNRPPHMKYFEDVLMSDKEEASIEDLEKKHSPVMDEHISAKESCCADELNKHHSTNLKDLQDDVNATIMESVQDALDARIFGLSTPLNTNKFNIVTPNLVTKSQWSLPDSQFSPDFPGAQVRELEASKERERYAFDGSTISEDLPNQLISDYSQLIEIGLLKYHASKKQTDNYYLKNAPGLGYPLLNFIVAQALSKNWFYLMSQPKMCWNDETERIDWSTLKAYERKLGLQTGEISHSPFDVEYVQNIPQQASDSLDCGVFVSAYAEILSEEQQVHLCEFEAASQRAWYASLLWHYGVTKAKKDYTSDNDDPPRPKNTFLQSPDESAIVTLE